MKVKIASDWGALLGAEFEKPYFARLTEFVRSEYTMQRIFPPASRIFAAFDSCPLSSLRVVVIGQDPYHGPGQANGLCFSVNDGVPFPPSLRNILKEVADDTGAPIPANGDLTRWANQGVLLLNSVLTVREGQAASHAGHGWEEFTDAVVAALNAHCKGLVYMLWGAYAARKAGHVSAADNCILKAAHPSPLSAHAGFFGCRHFSKANDYLVCHGKGPIKW